MSLSKLPTLADVQATRRNLAKPLPRVITKAEKKKSKLKAEAAFRKAVWTRDGRKSRASGKPLVTVGADYDRIGQIHHVIPRSLAPELIYEPSNGLLLSASEHLLAETCCHGDPSKRYLDIHGPTDRAQLQTFIWRNSAGEELRRRIG